MALEWVVLGYAAAAEAVMVLFLTMPGLGPLRKGLVAVIRNLLKPFLSIVPFCLFLFMDIYWKYETRPACDSAESCTPTEHPVAYRRCHSPELLATAGRQIDSPDIVPHRRLCCLRRTGDITVKNDLPQELMDRIRCDRLDL